MFQNLDVFKTAMAMARHAGLKQAYSAQNIANADTPGYRAKDIPEFAKSVRDSLQGQRATRAKHLNGSTGRSVDFTERRQALDPNGNTVSLEEEMVKAVDAKRQSDRALAIYRSNLSILRSAIGRR
ncbi:flagellar basal-body rod protein FlgB [Tropicibacter naphthalenivorans]|uniref:Flagellar basal body rod protein FlgB n=2 Tax=Tropicibacter naphthalenivorans TaxID=441103 RepID=A0A0P1GDJ0_9RHOB|nr:flagellar basal body rod protein FlgB [Tropicibacter naphthalenivorans]SMC74778.1 flagellar basal-body rod protein FlgB [Tropicibacter naphthalenivorans]